MFSAIFYNPLYNAVVAITSVVPAHNLALAIVIFTIIIKFILLPLSKKAVVTQMKIKLIEPEIKAIKDKYKDDRRLEAEKTLELYKKHKLNPFSTIFLALLQIPIFIALALMFSKDAFANIDPNLLYSFVKMPLYVDHTLFSLNMSERSVILGALAGIFQFIQIQYSIPAYKKPEKGTPPSFKDDLARSMNVQMRYVLPVIVFVTSLGFTASLALYWIVSTLFTICQELYFRRTIKKEA